MERLTMTSPDGGVALKFDLDVTCEKSEIMKLLKVFERLKEYEDLEEQGKLIKFDCSIGDTVYRTSNVKDMIDSEPMVYKCKVTGIKKEFNSTYYYLHADINEDNYSIWVDNWFDRCQIGYEFYLTKEEAEKALERLEKEND